MKRHFCTCFDKGYASRGLALHRSLLRHGGSFHLWILCLDTETHAMLEKLHLRHVSLVPLAVLEQHDPELLAAKSRRSRVEYYFTLTPCFPSFLLQTRPEIDLITYLDADLFFYRSPSPIWQEMSDADVVIIPHRFPPAKIDCEKYGKYNVGWVSFRRSPNGLACLAWWKAQCLEWCHDHLDEQGRYADQKYLDSFPALFDGVHAVTHPGANLAPWNLAGHRVWAEDGAIMVDDHPLLFYHFHNLTKVGERRFDAGLVRYEVQASSVVEELIYQPYLRELIRRGSLPLGNIRAPGKDAGPDTGPFFDVPRTGWTRLLDRVRAKLRANSSSDPGPNHPHDEKPASSSASLNPQKTNGTEVALNAIEKALRQRRESGWWFLSPRAWALRVAREELKRLSRKPPAND